MTDETKPPLITFHRACDFVAHPIPIPPDIQREVIEGLLDGKRHIAGDFPHGEPTVENRTSRLQVKEALFVLGKQGFVEWGHKGARFTLKCLVEQEELNRARSALRSHAR